MTRNILESFIRMSHAIGKNPAYAQGGGGNTSVKLDDVRMAIKASGYRLTDMSSSTGYSIVNYTAVRTYIENPSPDEDTFSATIKSCIMETQNRPSIETGFHALLGKYVIHTHSVYANILTCSQEGKNIAQELFPEALWIDYATPGRSITLAVKQALDAREFSPSIIFLANHGVIISANEAVVALEEHEAVTQEIQSYLGAISPFNPGNVMEDIPFLDNHVLFPDQVVYTLSGSDLLGTEAACETLAAYRFILGTIKEKQLTPCFISSQYVDILRNMESEKYRQQLLRK